MRTVRVCVHCGRVGTDKFRMQGGDWLEVRPGVLGRHHECTAIYACGRRMRRAYRLEQARTAHIKTNAEVGVTYCGRQAGPGDVFDDEEAGAGRMFCLPCTTAYEAHCARLDERRAAQS